MKSKRNIIKSCCGNSRTTLELDSSVLHNFISIFANNGFIANESYSKSGFFYAENNDLIVIGPFGGNSLQIKCKNNKCDDSILKVEEILASI